MRYLNVRLTPWAMERITRDYLTRPGGKVAKMSKTALRASLADMPDTEFHTTGQPGMRAGAVVTTREALDLGTVTLEVRFNGDRDVAMIDCATGRVS